jgi:hypothetical protein
MDSHWIECVAQAALEEPLASAGGWSGDVPFHAGHTRRLIHKKNTGASNLRKERGSVSYVLNAQHRREKMLLGISNTNRKNTRRRFENDGFP